VSRPIEAHTLIRSHKTSIVVLTLLTLLLAQAAAGMHALKHSGQQDDRPGLPGQHSQLCLECTAFAPLAGAHGGRTESLVVAFFAGESPRPLAQPALAAQLPQASYQSRAPPR
jgi:hypothetical protein